MCLAWPTWPCRVAVRSAPSLVEAHGPAAPAKVQAAPEAPEAPEALEALQVPQAAVTVRNLPGRVLATVCPIPDDVRKLKEEIAEQTGHPPALQAEVQAAVTVPAEVQAAVTVRNLPGRVLGTVCPIPDDVRKLKEEIAEQTGHPPALQKLVKFGGADVYADDDKLSTMEPLEVVMIVDETALCTWDIKGNPGRDMLEGDGWNVRGPKLSCDFCNVLTKEPLRSGAHYFEFVMHVIGDEQWCGVVADPKQAGPRRSGRSLTAWTYYCGRMRSRSSSIVDGQAALHAEGRAVKSFKKPRGSGDVIGMLVDMGKRAVAFDLNGELQGACAIPDQPLWVLTHLDTRKDHVELRKPSLQEAPPANLQALMGALLEVSKGQPLRPGFHLDLDYDSEDYESEPGSPRGAYHETYWPPTPPLRPYYPPPGRPDSDDEAAAPNAA